MLSSYKLKYYIYYLINSYMILAPVAMTAEKDPKEAARKCLEEVGLDPESYRIGHTKARRSCYHP